MQHVIPSTLEKSFLHFLESVPPGRFSRELREMFFEYLTSHHENLPINFHHTLDDLFFLFALLDKAQDEVGDWHRDING